jgi:hypothetical protein
MISDDIKLWLGSDAGSRNVSNISGAGSCESRHMLVAYDGRLDRLFLELVEFSRVVEDCRENECVLNISIPDKDHGSFVSACMLIGSYLILKEGKDYDAVANLFRSESFVLDLSAKPDPNAQISVSDCWRALEAAVRQGWFEPRPTGEEAALDLEELLHYAQRANGLVFMPIPGELYFFSTPDDSLGTTADWADSIDADGLIARRFSPGFTADLLSDLGTTVAVCLDNNTSPAAREALARRGVAAADLLLPADGSALMRGLDRLLLLLAAAPGAVAVHSGRGREWPGYAGALVQAVLMSRLGFDARTAEVWLRLTCSWMLCDDARDAHARDERI